MSKDNFDVKGELINMTMNSSVGERVPDRKRTYDDDDDDNDDDDMMMIMKLY